MKHKDLRPWLSVIAGGESLVSHAGGVLLIETARRSGLSGQLTRLLGRWRKPLAVHDPGKIVADLAVAVALGGDAAADIAVLRAQPGVFGLVASDPTVSRLISTLAADAEDAVVAISAARAAARERVWSVAGAPVQDGRVVIDLDATLVTAHSEKQDATRTWKKGFGFHPLLSFVDHGTASGGEPVAELLRPGKAGSNTAADHVVVLDAALAQLPAVLRARDETGRVPVLVRTDAAGATKDFAAHLHAQGVEFSVGASFAHLDVHTALAALPAAAWTPAYQARKPRAAEHGVQIEPRDGAWVAEVTGLIPLTGWPTGTRLILRKERPHPGAQLRTTDADGLRITGFLTNTTRGGPRAARRPGTTSPPPRPRRGSDQVGEGHRAGQPALPRHRSEPHLGRHRRARRGPAGLVRAARPPGRRGRLRTQTDAATDPRLRRAAGTHRAPPRPAHRLHLAMGRDDHHGTSATLRDPRALTRPPRPHDRGPGAPADHAEPAITHARSIAHTPEDQPQPLKITVRPLRKIEASRRQHGNHAPPGAMVTSTPSTNTAYRQSGCGATVET